MSDQQVQAAVDRANRSLPDYARIGHWLRLDTSLTFEDGLLTDNGRPRRERIAACFGPAIDSLYTVTKEYLAL